MLEQRFEPCTADPGHRTSQAPVVLSITSGQRRLDLPVQPPRCEGDALAPLPEPESAPSLATTRLREGWRVRLECAAAMTAGGYE